MVAGKARKASAIKLSEDERDFLQRLVRRRKVARGDAQRAEIILRAAKGLNNCEIADTVGVTRQTVRTWRERFAKHRLDGLDDEPRCGAPRKIGDDRIEEIVTRTLETKPKDATHWSTRGMAKASGVSTSTVHRIWRAFSLQPHRTETFKLSTDPQFVEKVRDIVGLYLDPPDKALVLAVDEKSQIQALDRTQPGLPLKKGRAGTMTHDYKRHGTTTLFAALNVATGEVIGQCMKRHRHEEWLRFLRAIDRAVPGPLDVHLIADNYATHKHLKVKAWLAKHPRFHMHFTPTSASWLNQVERFFGLITEQRIRRGVFHSVAELEAAIHDYLEHHNANPKPFVWTASAVRILEKVARGRQALESQH
jgi:transposase